MGHKTPGCGGLWAWALGRGVGSAVFGAMGPGPGAAKPQGKGKQGGPHQGQWGPTAHRVWGENSDGRYPDLCTKCSMVVGVAVWGGGGGGGDKD